MADPIPAPVSAPDQKATRDDLGLSIDMLDVDRLRQWAQLLLNHGADISYWASVPFVVSTMQILATNVEKAIRDIGVLRSALPASVAPPQEDRYYALRDAVTMYAGDGVISDDAVISMANEQATIAQRCTCAISDDRTERGTPQLRIVPLLSLQRLEWAYPYGSEEPYVKIADIDKISRPPAVDAPQEPTRAVYCSACHDHLNCGQVLGYIPLSTCARCGTLCMGYGGIPHIPISPPPAVDAVPPVPTRCDAELCVCGHFECAHTGPIYRGSYTCESCNGTCLGFRAASVPPRTET